MIARKSLGIHLPRGFGFGFICFPVALVDSIDEETAYNVGNSDFPKHWAAAEKLVVVNLDNSTLYYSEKSPDWGSVYHDYDRQLINKMLSP
jgi:hypothetical protein